ncbi:hypothetical protein PR048_023824 [Dryococelus australis]|uniref:Uncharacterized protein n=1 Tax=Dryococelus australis TaxID=614101 RepID=A0ABQ9GVA1_9NEOP|nr:hypothetical protein PR048_023824 [Dryococelus australis]
MQVVEDEERVVGMWCVGSVLGDRWGQHRQGSTHVASREQMLLLQHNTTNPDTVIPQPLHPGLNENPLATTPFHMQPLSTTPAEWGWLGMPRTPRTPGSSQCLPCDGLQCQHYHGEYICLTIKTLRQRMNGHRTDTKEAIADHINNPQDQQVLQNMQHHTTKILIPSTAPELLIAPHLKGNVRRGRPNLKSPAVRKAGHQPEKPRRNYEFPICHFHMRSLHGSNCPPPGKRPIRENSWPPRRARWCIRFYHLGRLPSEIRIQAALKLCHKLHHWECDSRQRCPVPEDTSTPKALNFFGHLLYHAEVRCPQRPSSSLVPQQLQRCRRPLRLQHRSPTQPPNPPTLTCYQHTHRCGKKYCLLKALNKIEQQIVNTPQPSTAEDRPLFEPPTLTSPRITFEHLVAVYFDLHVVVGIAPEYLSEPHTTIPPHIPPALQPTPVRINRNHKQPLLHHRLCSRAARQRKGGHLLPKDHSRKAHAHDHRSVNIRLILRVEFPKLPNFQGPYEEKNLFPLSRRGGNPRRMASPGSSQSGSRGPPLPPCLCTLKTPTYHFTPNLLHQLHYALFLLRWRMGQGNESKPVPSALSQNLPTDQRQGEGQSPLSGMNLDAWLQMIVPLLWEPLGRSMGHGIILSMEAWLPAVAVLLLDLLEGKNGRMKLNSNKHLHWRKALNFKEACPSIHPPPRPCSFSPVRPYLGLIKDLIAVDSTWELKEKSQKTRDILLRQLQGFGTGIKSKEQHQYTCLGASPFLVPSLLSYRFQSTPDNALSAHLTPSCQLAFTPSPSISKLTILTIRAESRHRAQAALTVTQESLGAGWVASPPRATVKRRGFIVLSFVTFTYKHYHIQLGNANLGWEHTRHSNCEGVKYSAGLYLGFYCSPQLAQKPSCQYTSLKILLSTTSPLPPEQLHQFHSVSLEGSRHSSGESQSPRACEVHDMSSLHAEQKRIQDPMPNAPLHRNQSLRCAAADHLIEPVITEECAATSQSTGNATEQSSESNASFCAHSKTHQTNPVHRDFAKTFLELHGIAPRDTVHMAGCCNKRVGPEGNVISPVQLPSSSTALTLPCVSTAIHENSHYTSCFTYTHAYMRVHNIVVDSTIFLLLNLQKCIRPPSGIEDDPKEQQRVREVISGWKICVCEHWGK